MVKLDILKQLQLRRRRKVEINKSMHDNIQYHANLQMNVDREINRAEKHRIQGLLLKPGCANPMLLRHRYEELSKLL